MEQTKVEQGKAAKANTVASIMGRKKAVTKSETIQLDGELANRISELKDLLADTKMADRKSNEPDKASKVQAEIDALTEQARDTEAVFTFRSIGRLAYDDLVDEHPPSKDAKKEGAEFNADTFPPALISASCSRIVTTESDTDGLTYEEATDIFSSPDWNGAELRRLFFAARDVNIETGDVPLSGSGSGETLNSLLSLITQQNAGSPTPSTLGG